MNKTKMMQMARELLKKQLSNEWPRSRCACGDWGATDLAHIVYTRHPDSADLYSRANCVLLHNKCNTTGEALWININACLIILKRVGGPDLWEEWAKMIPRKGSFWIPEKMVIAMELWEKGVRPYDFQPIMDYLADRPVVGGK